jgi:hypothetical protein
VTEISISNGISYFLLLTLIGFLVFLSPPMHSFVTATTKSDQIGFDVIALPAARPNMMDLETLHPSARLATPAISV